jgi:hypothetical protein
MMRLYPGAEAIISWEPIAPLKVMTEINIFSGTPLGTLELR